MKLLAHNTIQKGISNKLKKIKGQA